MQLTNLSKNRENITTYFIYVFDLVFSLFLLHLRSSNVDGCKGVAKRIVDQVLKRGVLSLDLTDLRCFDGYTYAHSVNVAVLCCIIGFGMKMNEQSLEQLVMA